MHTSHRVTAVAFLAGALLTSGVLFQRAEAAEYPWVGDLTPFSAEANYMSLAGYLRFLVANQDGVWITRPEAVQIVLQQQEEPRAGIENEPMIEEESAAPKEGSLEESNLGPSGEQREVMPEEQPTAIMTQPEMEQPLAPSEQSPEETTTQPMMEQPETLLEPQPQEMQTPPFEERPHAFPEPPPGAY